MTVAKKSSAQTVQRKRLADRTTPTTADCMYVSVRGIARRAASLFMAGDERRCGMRRALGGCAGIFPSRWENVFPRIGGLSLLG
jgi:hypothetical protein